MDKKTFQDEGHIVKTQNDMVWKLKFPESCLATTSFTVMNDTPCSRQSFATCCRSSGLILRERGWNAGLML